MRIEFGLEPLLDGQQRRRAADRRPRRTCRPPGTAWHGRRGSRAHARSLAGIGARACVEASAARRPTRPAARRRGRHAARSTSPKAARAGSAARAAAKNGMRVVADAAPEGRVVGRPPRRRCSSPPRVDRRRRPRQAHREPAAAWHVADSGSGWPPHSFTRRIASSTGSSNASVASRSRQRQALERDLGEHAERAQRAAHQSRDIEAGDVLHHPAAEAQVVAAAVEHAHAEHEVAHGAGIRPPRPRQARTRPCRRAWRRREVRRLEARASGRCAAIVCSISASGVPAARGDDELGRLVVDDAGVRRVSKTSPSGASP